MTPALRWVGQNQASWFVRSVVGAFWVWSWFWLSLGGMQTVPAYGQAPLRRAADVPPVVVFRSTDSAPTYVSNRPLIDGQFVDESAGAWRPSVAEVPLAADDGPLVATEWEPVRRIQAYHPVHEPRVVAYPSASSPSDADVVGIPYDVTVRRSPLGGVTTTYRPVEGYRSLEGYRPVEGWNSEVPAAATWANVPPYTPPYAGSTNAWSGAVPAARPVYSSLPEAGLPARGTVTYRAEVPALPQVAPGAASPFPSVAPAGVPIPVGRPVIVRTKVYYPGQPLRNSLRALTP